MLRRTDTAVSMQGHRASPPVTPAGRRAQRHTESLQTMRTRLGGSEFSPRLQSIRLVGASSAEELQGVDSDGNIVLPIDYMELRGLRDGEVVTLPSSPDLTSLGAVTRATSGERPAQLATAPHTDMHDTSSIGSADSTVVPAGAASSWGGSSGPYSTASLADQYGPHMPPATSETLKSSRFRDNLAVVGSAMYATFLVIIGLIVFVADIAKPTLEIAEIYTSVISLVGLAWLVVFHVQVKLYMSRLAQVAKSTQDGLGALERQLILEPTDVEGEYRVKMPFKQTLAEMIRCQYSFSVGRHSGSFYVKIGAAFFCFGNLVHLLLLLIRQINNLVSHGDECIDLPAVVLYIIQPVFSFFQLYVTFKYSNIVINHFRTSARFGFMHCIASSFNMWIWSIVKETVDAVQEHSLEHGTGPHLNITNCSECTVSVALEETSLVYLKCAFNDSISETIAGLSGYLYPLTIEFNILIVGVWFIIWQNIGNGLALTAVPLLVSTVGVWFIIWQNIGNTRVGQFLTGDMTEVEGVMNQTVLHIDCTRANRGVLGGLLVFVFTVVDIILFFSLNTEPTTAAQDTVAQYISQGTEALLTALMTVLCLLAYKKLTHLDVNIHPVSFLDDLLLFICLPAYFLYAIIILVPALFPAGGDHSTPLDIMMPLLVVTEVVIQTPFIMDGLRRCSNTDDLRAAKPGREFVTVLLFTNLAMWLLQTLETQASQESLSVDFYGMFIWTLLQHATMPLCLFYRFHSSVCLADIWKSAYEPGS